MTSSSCVRFLVCEIVSGKWSKCSSAFEKMRRENSEQNIFQGQCPVMRQQQSDEEQGADAFLLQEYEQFLSNKAEGTMKPMCERRAR